jgi:O-acetyl-ADP-ribose deacetylase (regulator of RNase III)
MKTISYLQGDATFPQGDGNKIIAHVCNDSGYWNKGFVNAVSARWPEPERDYRAIAEKLGGQKLQLGSVQLRQVEENLCVANLIAQSGIRSSHNPKPIRYDALKTCLHTLHILAFNWCNASVHMPRISCGLAGGDWSEVEPIVGDPRALFCG